jgi:predicted DNA-binding transcriptional regulator AlpA
MNYSHDSSPKDLVFDLDDEVWTLGHIAKFMGQKERSLYGLVREPGFPRPLNTQSRNRRWLKQQVILFLEQRSVQRVHTYPLTSLPSGYEPKSIQFKRTGTFAS